MAVQHSSFWPGRVGGVALVLAPTLLVASTASYIANGAGMNDGEAGGALQVWAMIALAVGVVALTRRFADVAPRASVVLLVAGLAGAAAGVGYGIDSIQVAVFGTESIQDVDSAVAPFALQVPGILLPLGLLGIGIMLARTRTAPVWAAGLLALGAALFPVARIGDVDALALVGDSVLVAALVPMGWAAAASDVGARRPHIEARAQAPV